MNHPANITLIKIGNWELRDDGIIGDGGLFFVPIKKAFEPYSDTDKGLELFVLPIQIARKTWASQQDILDLIEILSFANNYFKKSRISRCNNFEKISKDTLRYIDTCVRNKEIDNQFNEIYERTK